MKKTLLLLVIALSSCCHPRGVILDKRTGSVWLNSQTSVDVFAYQIAVAETVWVASDIEYEKGDTLK